MPFKPGQSGNPGGRPKEVKHVRDLARQHTAGAVKVLAEIMYDVNEQGRARVAAAEAILSRGWGKPSAEVTVVGGISDEQRALLEALKMTPVERRRKASEEK